MRFSNFKGEETSTMEVLEPTTTEIDFDWDDDIDDQTRDDENFVNFFYENLEPPEDDIEVDHYDRYDIYEEDCFLFRNKKKNKHEKINPQRFVSSWEQSKKDRKQRNMSFHIDTKLFIPQENPSYSTGSRFMTEDEQMALALSMSLNGGSTDFVPLYDHEFDKLVNKSEQEVAPCGLSFKLIRELQTRDITPEDYELLMALEESVKKKTTNESVIDKLETIVVTKGMEGQCAICMGEYQVDEVLRKLPCKHAYHMECIDHWLKNNSTKCPLDGIEV